jgi:hypothetical protein
MPIRLAYDPLCFMTSHTADDTITICSRRHDTTGRRLDILCRLSLSRNTSQQKAEILRTLKSFARLCGQVWWTKYWTGRVGWGTLYVVWLERSFGTRKDKTDPVGKGLNVCGIFCNKFEALMYCTSTAVGTQILLHFITYHAEALMYCTPTVVGTQILSVTIHHIPRWSSVCRLTDLLSVPGPNRDACVVSSPSCHRIAVVSQVASLLRAAY